MTISDTRFRKILQEEAQHVISENPADFATNWNAPGYAGLKRLTYGW